jgi:hypothetical protein
MLAAFAGSGVAALNEGEGIGRDALHQNESQHPTKGKLGDCTERPPPAQVCSVRSSGCSVRRRDAETAVGADFERPVEKPFVLLGTASCVCRGRRGAS